MTKSFHSIALATSILGVCAFSQDANAATVSISNQLFAGNAPVAGTPAPVSDSGAFSESVSGSIAGVELSPYAFNTTGSDSSYSVLGSPGGGASSATYNVNSSSLAFLWGSPDPYNQIEFFSGPDRYTAWRLYR